MKFLQLVLLIGSAHGIMAQSYTSFTDKVNEIVTLATSTDSENRNANVDAWWNEMIKSNKIPLVVEDSVAFFYRGEAKSVSWMGDFNAWGSRTTMNTSGTRITNTDIWIWKFAFPKDARLDYKIRINDSDWIIDPHNPNQQWSGVGGGSPNSELRMPEWKQDPISIPKKGISTGELTSDLLFNSKSLGYQLTYSIYLPAEYDKDMVYPVVYVTDGYEYLHERMGNMRVILDNLIAQGKIKPIIVVLVDHREPVNRSNNRRMRELAMNQNFLTFFTDELIPHIEQNYAVTKIADQRAILGTSMGGLTAAYFAFARPDVFGMAGIQSPAFWFKPEIYTFCDNPENPPVKIHLTSGVINDAQEGARKMRDILEKNTCTYAYTEINQSHSWGNWRDLIDDILVYFFGI